jgi:hypothetical protein
MKFDAADGELMELRWHWPDIESILILSDLHKTVEILNHFQMNSLAQERNNITDVSIIYYVPPTIQESSYDTDSDVYIIAPYLIVHTEKRSTYILGIMLPEEYF